MANEVKIANSVEVINPVEIPSLLKLMEVVTKEEKTEFCEKIHKLVTPPPCWSIPTSSDVLVSLFLNIC